MRSTAWLGLALVLAAGCARTPEPRYYTLDMASSGRVDAAYNLTVYRIQLHDSLARSDILIKESPTEVEYYANDHWASSVAELVQQKLTAEFGPPVEGRKSLRLSGTVLACGQVDVPGGAEGRVKLYIEVHDPEKKRYQRPLLEKIYEASWPASRPTAAAVVVALSQCVEQVAAEIAADLSVP